MTCVKTETVQPCWACSAETCSITEKVQILTFLVKTDLGLDIGIMGHFDNKKTHLRHLHRFLVNMECRMERKNRKEMSKKLTRKK